MEATAAVVPVDSERPARSDIGAVTQQERIESIDVLRGVAVLGILVMNIQSFAMVGMAYVNPYIHMDMSGANYWVWYLSYLFADQKFITIFSMLFGAGIVLMTSRQKAAVGRSAGVHYRRMLILLLFGLMHAYLIWYGDILVAYALCGMVVYLFRNFRPWLLIILGVFLLYVGLIIPLATYYSMPFWPKEAIDGMRQGMGQSAKEISEEIAAYRGSWFDAFKRRAPASLVFQTFMFFYFTFWKAAGLMLIGMGLFKLGRFSATSSRATYLAYIAIGFLVGIPFIAFGEQQAALHDWDPIYRILVAGQYNYLASFLVSLAYVGIVMLICQHKSWERFTKPFAAVGQMAFTNYLLHSIICTTLFYGHGFGLFGRVERTGQILIVFAIWAFQLIVSPIWLSYFRFGPAEWLWRALTYWKLPPFRRS